MIIKIINVQFTDNNKKHKNQVFEIWCQEFFNFIKCIFSLRWMAFLLDFFTMSITYFITLCYQVSEY